MIKRILNWFQAAKPQPTVSDARLQVGCNLEEVSEMLMVFGDEASVEQITEIADYYKEPWPYGAEQVVFSAADPTELLDALCDQIITAVGVAYMMGYDIEGALAEVCRSNESKFEDGNPVFDRNGKIAKGKNYTAPDLARFIGGATQIEEVTYPKTKGADLYLKLVSDKGYRSEEIRRISPHQWHQIQIILNEKGENE